MQNTNFDYFVGLIICNYWLSNNFTVQLHPPPISITDVALVGGDRYSPAW